MLAFQEFGDGPPVVLFHGLFGSSDNLRAVARGLEEAYRLILPDLPNRGSSPHIGSSTHEAMVDSIARFLDEEVEDNPVIGGHSIGGKLAMLLALRNPDRFSALVVIDMAPREYEASHVELIEAMRSVPLDEIGARRDADAHLASVVTNAGVRSFLLKNLVRRGDSFAWRLDLAAIEADYQNMLGWRPPEGTYDRPCLFAGGERSRYLQADRDRDLIHSLFPRAQIRMIKDAGHWLHADKPEEVVQVIRSFLDGLEIR